jgi:hypothetical protein
METTKNGVSRVTEWRNVKKENESLKQLLSDAQKENEKINDVSKSLIQNLKSMEYDYQLLKRQNDKLQNVSNELKQENTDLKQLRDMFQSRCNLLETDKNNRSGLLKKPAHIIAVLIVFLIANVWHNAAGYGQAGGNFYFGLFVVMSLDLAVLTFVGNAMKRQAALYALGTFVITFLSFNPDLFSGQYIVVSAIFAAAFSYGIYSFSELFENKN